MNTSTILAFNFYMSMDGLFQFLKIGQNMIGCNHIAGNRALYVDHWHSNRGDGLLKVPENESKIQHLPGDFGQLVAAYG